MIDFNSPDEALEIMLAQDKQLVGYFNNYQLNQARQKLQNWHLTWDGWKITEPKPSTVTQQVLDEIQYRALYKTTSIWGADCHKAVYTFEVPLADPSAAKPVATVQSPVAKKTTKKVVKPKPNAWDGTAK